MFKVTHRLSSARYVAQLVWGLAVAVAVAGCANSPKRMGIPWWPQGPGIAPEDVAPISSAEQLRTQNENETAIAPAWSTQPAHHSEAMRNGNLLFVSGQIADDPTSLAIVDGGIEEQVRAAMDNVVRVLEIHGMGIRNIVSVTLYLQDLEQLPKADAVYATYFSRKLPARSVLRVDGLPKGSLVEIAVIAGK